jgi:2-dehydro-3-deoxyphosphogluconate aldolase/(4S)-4-hydroxy-2-oxoglutarate aldolase
MFEKFYKKLEKAALVPVVALNDAKKAVPLSKALYEGGIPAIEVTFRTDAAEEAIKLIAKECPAMFVGAGTIINANQAKTAVDAGAQFLVSPGFVDEVADWAIANKIPYLPGVCTPSEVMNVLLKGLNVMKFFPAEASGGINMLNNLGGPFPQVKFMVTGGIGPKNMEEYIKTKNVIALGGSWVSKSNLIDNNEWKTITDLSKEATQKIKEIKSAKM